MSVQLCLGNIESRIVGFLPKEINDDLDNTLCYRIKGIEHSKKVKEKKWDGYTRLYRPSRQSYLTGLQSIVAEILTKHKIQYIRKDLRVRPEVNMPNLVFTPPSHYKTRDYQQIAIDRAYQSTRGILKMATGSGKTLTIVELISKIKTGPFMFYVLTKDLLDQAHDTLSSCLNVPIGKIGGGECEIHDINVCTIQTAIRAVNLNHEFNIKDYIFDEEDAQFWSENEVQSVDKLQNIKNVIAASKGIFQDEAHHASCQTIKDLIKASPNAYWKFGGTATPFRDDGADLMIQALFGKKLVDVNASYLIEHGYLCQPHILFSPLTTNCQFHSYKAIYKECISHNETLNSNIAEIAKYLMGKGLTVLILVQQYNQGEYIKKKMGGDIEFVTGKMSKTKRKEALDNIRNGKAKSIIGTTLYDEGIDCPALDAVILGGGGASSSRIYQRIGRVLRTNSEKARALVICFEPNAKYIGKHSRRIKRIVKMEPKFDVINANEGLDIIQDINKLYGWDKEQKTLFS